jgi:hypothetical protein
MMTMKKIIVPFILLFIALQSNSQYVLETPDGPLVKLNSNGTWLYISAKKEDGKGTLNPDRHMAIYRATNNQFQVNFDPNEWICDSTKQKELSGWDASFNSMDLAITAYCLASRLSLPVDQIEYAMRQQWRDAGTITLFNTYKDTINGTPVTGFDMKLEANNIFYTYKGYTYSTLKGSFQFLVGTQGNIFEEDKAKIEALIKGFKKI